MESYPHVLLIRSNVVIFHVSAINTVKNLVTGTDGAKPPEGADKPKTENTEEPGTSGGGGAEPEASTSGEGKIGGISNYLSQCMRFPTMWYVRPAKPRISLRICAI